MTVTETLAVAARAMDDAAAASLAAALRLPTVFDDEERTRLRVDELIELMSLGAYRNSFIRELSTGTRRIVDLACQVAPPADGGPARRAVQRHRPARGRGARAGAAAAARRDGREPVVIEHDMPLISSISDRLIALDQGESSPSGSPADVLTHPDVVESYLGNNASGAISAPALRG